MAVKVLADHFLGLTRYCDGCGALLGYNWKDLYEGKYIYCPICKMKLEVDLR